MHNTLLKRFPDSCSDNLKSKTCPFDILRAGSESYRRIQNPKWAGSVALVLTLAMCGAVAEAQQAKKIPRIGYLSSLSPSSESSRSEAIRLALREVVYIEGQNI